MNESIEIKWRDSRIYLSLQQMQQIINGINSDYLNSELCSMLDLFVANNNSEDKRADRETLERQVAHDLDQERKSDD